MHFSYECLADRPRPRPKGRGGRTGDRSLGATAPADKSKEHCANSAIEGRCDRVLRLFVEAILAAPYDQCQAGQPVALQAAGRANRSSICAASRSSLGESTGDTNKGGTGVYIPC